MCWRAPSPCSTAAGRGPVHIELPLDVITADGRPCAARRHPHQQPPGPDPDAIARAAAAAARAPSVRSWCSAAAPQHAGCAARALVERLGAPPSLTINAKGVLPPDHPLSLGSTLPQPPVLEALHAADVVLAVGTELGETDTLLFDSRLRLGGKVIRIDIDAEQLTRNALPEVAIAQRCRARPARTRSRAAESQDRSAPRRRRGRRSCARSCRACSRSRSAPHQRFLDAVPQALPGRDRGRRFDPAGLRRQPRLPAGAAALLVQFLHRLRHARLRPAGRVRRQARPAASGRWSR